MDIGKSVIRRRIKQYEFELQGNPDIGKALTAEQKRIRQREEKNRSLPQYNDISKKLPPSSLAKFANL